MGETRSEIGGPRMTSGILISVSAWFLVVLTPAIVLADPGQEPARPAARHQQSAEVIAFRKTAIPVSFPSNGLSLRGWLYKPQGDGPLPAVIWNHGSERDPIAHPELGRFYASHGF